MKCVNKLLFLTALLIATNTLAQSSEKLKQEQKKIEKKISDTKLLLEKTKKNTAASLNQLQVIENQIRFREQLLVNYDNQIRSAELKIMDKQQQIQQMREKIVQLKAQYRRLLLYAYKHRNKYGKLMFIFAADNYYEAVKRNKYLAKISEIQAKQFHLIKQNQRIVGAEISAIENEKKDKLTIVNEKKVEKEQIVKDREKQEQIYQKFKSEEQRILADLKREERNKAILKQQITAAINKEIAEAEAKRKKEEAARKAASKPKTETAATNTNVAETKPATPDFSETKESEALSKSFEGNRGKLPWPVEKGTITENFGKNAHPTLKNVFTENRGIDISTPKNAKVRAVFEGEVTSVLNIPGAGKVVIIKHGNYRTVYTNLQETYVKTGDKVYTKKAIGSLLQKESENISVAHFEIHQVVGATVNCLNPSLWVAR